MQTFNASNEPGTCLWCGRKLRRAHFTERESVPIPLPKRSRCCGAELYEAPAGTWRCSGCDKLPQTHKSRITLRRPVHEKAGDYGDGHFCGLRCGYAFGRRLADLGRRLVRS